MSQAPNQREVQGALEASNAVVGRLITLMVDLELGVKRTDGEGRPLTRADIKLLENTRETLRKLESDVRDAGRVFRESVRSHHAALEETHQALDALSSKSELVDGLLDAAAIGLAAAPLLMALPALAAAGATTAFVVGTASALGSYVVAGARAGDMTALQHNEEVTGLAAGLLDDGVKALGPEAVKAALAKEGLPKLGELLAKPKVTGNALGGAFNVLGLGSALLDSQVFVEAVGLEGPLDTVGISPQRGAAIALRPGSGESLDSAIGRVRDQVSNAGWFTGDEQARANNALDRLGSSKREMDRAARELVLAARRHALFMKYAFDTWVTSP
jgi:hypothetical protein